MVVPLTMKDRRAKLVKRYGLTLIRSDHFLTPRMVKQVEMCRSEAARRLILGVSRKTVLKLIEPGSTSR